MNLIDIAIPLVIMLFYTIGASYSAYQVWWKFDELQENLIRRNETRRFFGASANVWIKHWTYKWLFRIVVLLMVFVGSISFVGMFYEFMIVLLGLQR